ncbi:hypothetical protein QBC39DRAFT_353041 [Podospora conica]|nr:hypothetical protein QBC39DRAFT_353041 [Schizothecium conicum]
MAPPETTPNLRNTETIVPPPHPPPIPPFKPHTYPHHGPSTLLVIPTKNKFKTSLLRNTFASRAPAGADLVVLTLPVPSDVGEQPYNTAGCLGACNRISNALEALHAPEHDAFLRTNRVGTVMVAAIENYIQVDGVERPTDFGMIVVHNATTGATRACVSAGVTVAREFVERAQAFGFEGNKDYGRVTVGRVLAEEVPGVDEADWHVELAGRSRYDILEEAMGGLELPWDVGGTA